MVSLSRVSTDGTVITSRDSTFASVWRRLNRWVMRTITASGCVGAVGFVLMYAATGHIDLLLLGFLCVAIAATGALQLMRPAVDAEVALMTTAVAAVIASTFTSPILRGETWAVVVIVGMLGALVLPEHKQPRFTSTVAILLGGQLSWQLLGWANTADTIASVAVSATCGVAGIGLVRLAKHALQTSEQTRLEIFRRVPVGLFRVSPSGRIIDANPALAEMLGFQAPEEMIGYNVAGLHETSDEWTSLAQSLSTTDHPQRFAHRMVRRDGTVIWVRGHAQAIPSDDDGFVYYEGAVEDVTQRREAEQASQRNAERFHNVFERAPIGIWEEDFTAVGARLDELRRAGITDLQAHFDEDPDEILTLVSRIRLIDVNQAGINLMASPSKAEALRVTIPQTVEEATAAGFAEQFVAIWRGEDHLSSEVTGFTMTGETIECALSWSVGRHADGSLDLSRVVVAIQDIATVKEAERELATLVRLKDDLIASVSHELRTPMTTILGMAFELRDHGEKFTRTELNELISLIADQSRELANIVEDLLVAARADAGTLPVRPVRVDLALELEQITSLRPTMPDCDRVIAWADPLRVRQVVRNLLTNAERYGGDSVSIEIECDDDVALIRVQDDGVGVPTDSSQAIFDPYVRASQDDGLPGSLGLGLPVSRRLARLMGGDLVYRYNDGSVFELSLPTPPSEDTDS